MLKTLYHNVEILCSYDNVTFCDHNSAL